MRNAMAAAEAGDDVHGEKPLLHKHAVRANRSDPRRQRGS